MEGESEKFGEEAVDRRAWRRGRATACALATRRMASSTMYSA